MRNSRGTIRLISQTDSQTQQQQQSVRKCTQHVKRRDVFECDDVEGDVEDVHEYSMNDETYVEEDDGEEDDDAEEEEEEEEEGDEEDDGVDGFGEDEWESVWHIQKGLLRCLLELGQLQSVVYQTKGILSQFPSNTNTTATTTVAGVSLEQLQRYQQLLLRLRDEFIFRRTIPQSLQQQLLQLQPQHNSHSQQLQQQHKQLLCMLAPCAVQAAWRLGQWQSLTQILNQFESLTSTTTATATEAACDQMQQHLQQHHKQTNNSL